MLSTISPHVHELQNVRMPADQRGALLKSIGAKAAGLAILPRTWTPPFIVVSCDLYTNWAAASIEDRSSMLASVSASIADHCTRHWSAWSWGLALRSSASNETLRERGSFESRELPADFSADSILRIIELIYRDFQLYQTSGEIAVIVQARVTPSIVGHLSNERRVSITINQWMWEAEQLGDGQGRFNSQRDTPPPEDGPLLLGDVAEEGVVARLKQVARWCTALNAGRTHLEWGVAAGNLWLFQLDFEDDQPDIGVDPSELLRTTDTSPAGSPLRDSPFEPVSVTKQTGWPKVDKIGALVAGRSDPYPQLYSATGQAFRQARLRQRDLMADIEAIAKGRAVCRTDCVSGAIPQLNLPRTNTVSSAAALDFLIATLDSLCDKGARAEEVCFILHKFIPARTAAWAMARPGTQVVLVDALWGLPDGLQYLPHDTFEFDVLRDAISAEHIRYKHRFLQELENGDWSLVDVSRGLTRSRSLGTSDLRQVATETHAIACRANKPVQIMWFCDVANEARVGRNVPWFMMDAESPSPGAQEKPVGPRMPKVVVRGMADIGAFLASDQINCIFQLEPDAELFRDDSFIAAVIDAAKKGGCAVELSGSILSHAYYALERSGVNVITPSSGRARVRQRKIFGKLVRDRIPDRIREHGERVILAQIPKSESRIALAIKLFEECHELLKAESPQEVTGELADLLEVIRSLAAATGSKWEEVQTAAEKKRLSRGSFERNVVLLETSWPGWTARPQSGQVPTISVRKLAHVSENAGGHRTMSFASVLVKGAPNTIQLRDGTTISVSLGPAGVEIAEVAARTVADDQLKFDFED